MGRILQAKSPWLRCHVLSDMAWTSGDVRPWLDPVIHSGSQQSSRAIFEARDVNPVGRHARYDGRSQEIIIQGADSDLGIG